MLRLNIGLTLGGLAAVAVGLLGGWALFVGLPLQASALAAVETAMPSIAPAMAEPAAAAQSPAGRARDNPAPAPAPSAAGEAPSPAPSAASPNAPQATDAAGRPHIHLDGERSALSYEGGSGGLYINKDRLSVRTPFGKFDIDW
jgi:predicted lipid-binding transport protein (Tim44 family)